MINNNKSSYNVYLEYKGNKCCIFLQDFNILKYITIMEYYACIGTIIESA